MGCISSKKESEDIYPNIFQVMNVDEHGNHVNPGQLEITDLDLVLYQRGKSPIKWPLRTLRRYGFDAEHFSFESGRRCQTGPGIYAFRCRRAEQLFNLLQSRIQTRINGDSEVIDGTNNFVMSGSNRDSMYLEAASFRRTNPESRFVSQNGVTRLSSVGSASGSLGPLSPQSVTAAPLPLDTVPLIPPLPTNRPTNQNLYANENIVASIAQDLEETNNNKTVEEPRSPPLDHSYLNSGVLDLLPKDELNNPMCETQDLTAEELPNPNVDNNHLYMNIIPGTDKVAPRFPTVQALPSANFVTLKWEKTDDAMPTYANFEAQGSLPRKTSAAVNVSSLTTTTISNTATTATTATTPNLQAAGTKSLNYIVLDLEPSSDPPKSPTSIQPPELLRKQSGGYAAIDFKKTVALSHSVNPNFDTDSESSRKTRHSSNINSLMTHERHSSSVSD
ncbi:hypothetical protein RUM44_013587 [Polyplax serrata]|uniref:IRS-type PTB domain-containing protein n=1 Tax=Polyplax serrata TaxID=468196 RepID=A0ABR1BGH4_POLSC